MIYEDLDDCRRYSGDISNLVKEHPQFSIFGAKATEKTYQQILKIELMFPTFLLQVS
jgi:hypothetical protein